MQAQIFPTGRKRRISVYYRLHAAQEKPRGLRVTSQWVAEPEDNIMRFAMAATSDRYVGVFETFVLAGWQPVKLFTAGGADTLEERHAVTACAERSGAAVQLSRMTGQDIQGLRALGCEALIVAGYI
jgi:hypothetical protein